MAAVNTNGVQQAHRRGAKTEIIGHMIGTGPKPKHVFHDFNLVISDAQEAI